MRSMRSIVCLLFLGVLASCAKPKSPEVIGLDGRAFYEPVRSVEQQSVLTKNLTEAKKKWEKDPSEDNYLWYGRREGYLMHLQKAIDIYTEGLEKFPDSYRLYRHRAHRYISIRDFDNAIRDSWKAIELMENKPIESEPDGAPNKLNIPKSTTQSNVWYHLGLAYYLKGEYSNAAEAYEACLKFSDNDDLLVATTDWLYMTYHRLGRKEDAEALLTRIQSQMSIIENEAYHKRLLMYKGEYQPELLLAVLEGGQDPDFILATQGYGVGNWYLIQGDTAKAVDLLKRVVAGPSFTAFGFIAAEVDLLRLDK